MAKSLSDNVLNKFNRMFHVWYIIQTQEDL